MPKLPPEHLEKSPTVADMIVGESGYVIDFALEVFDDDTAYLKGHSKVFNGDYNSSAYLYVERRADGLCVRLPEGATFKPSDHKHKWSDERYEVVAWLE